MPPISPPSFWHTLGRRTRRKNTKHTRKPVTVDIKMKMLCINFYYLSWTVPRLFRQRFNSKFLESNCMKKKWWPILPSIFYHCSPRRQACGGAGVSPSCLSVKAGLQVASLWQRRSTIHTHKIKTDHLLLPVNLVCVFGLWEEGLGNQTHNLPANKSPVYCRAT